jgi:hypothetical protein
MERLSTLTTTLTETHRVHDAVRYLALALDGTRSAELLQETYLARYPQSVSASLLRTKAASNPIDTTSGAGLLPPVMLDALISAMQRDTVLTKIPGLVRAPLLVHLPSVTTDPSIAWMTEASPKPVSQPILGNIVLTASKCAGIVVLTRELVHAQPLAAGIIAGILIRAATAFVDSQFLDPTVAAVVGKNPRSITNGITATTAAATLAGSVAAVLAALFTQRPQTVSPVLIMSPATAGSLGTSLQVNASSGALTFGVVPVAVSVGAGANVIAMDSNAIYYNDDGGQVDSSEYASVQMDTAPGAVTASTVLINLWNENKVGVRLDRFVTWQRAADNAVAIVTPGAV